MSKKILIIEDDPGTTRFLVYTLEHEGYTVLSAADGLEGFKKAQDEHPDLVILDVMLPGMDGYEVCHRLRKKAETLTMPVLMVSGRARQDDKNIGLRMGADVYLAKPVDPETILAKVETLLAGTGNIVNVES
ncbi:MAG: response regulator [Dehalococcoidia bacterium]|nr:response regulator [Dehalococcoidia bacterium]